MVLSRRTARAITQARETLARGVQKRAVSEGRAIELHRRLDISSVVLLRIQGSRGRDARPAQKTFAIYRRAWGLALEAGHESLAMSLLLDAARFAMDSGRLELAGQITDRVEHLASQQQNARRWTQALIVRARIRARLGQESAWYDLARAEKLYEGLQTLDARSRRPAKDWYQPGLLRHIEETRVEIEPFVARPEEWAWWEP